MKHLCLYITSIFLVVSGHLSCKKNTTDSKELFDLYFHTMEGHKLKYIIIEKYITVKYSENVSEEEINQLNSGYGLSKEPLF